MINNSGKYIPMRSEFIIDSSLTEILGKANLAVALGIARKSQSDQTNKNFAAAGQGEFSLLAKALETLYGPQTGAGIAFRAGRVALRYSLSSFGKELGFSVLDFRLLPLQNRISAGLERISRYIDSQYDIHSSIQSEKNYLIVQIFNCPECKGRTSDSGFCHFISGFLHEYLAWMGGGRYFPVKETSCLANGSSCCTFELARQPLD